MYTAKLGYVEVDEKIVALRSVRALFETLGEKLDVVVFEALRLVAEAKAPVVGVKPPALLQISAHDAFRANSDPYFHLLQLLTLNFAADKLYDNPPSYYRYTFSPVMPLDELVEATVADDIMFISLNGDLLGDRTIWQSYQIEFIEWLHAVLRIADDTNEILGNVLRYRQHIVFKLANEQPLDPTEKTFICNYYPGSNYAPKSWEATVTAHENENPLVSRDFQKLVTHGESGPFSKYFRLVSNQSIEQLTAIVIPGLSAIPVNIGSITPRGCVSTLAMSPLATIAYNDSLELAGYRERLRTVDPGVFPNNNGNEKSLIALLCTPALPAGVNTRLYPAFSGMKLPFDLPEVELTLRPPAESLNPKLVYSGLTATWVSKWRGRKVSTFTGATVDDLLTDIALTNATYGSGAPIQSTLPDKGVIFSNEPTIKDRIVNVGTLTSSAVAAIKFTFYIWRQMKLETHEVDMRMHYARRGTNIILPAGVEFIHPPSSMLYSNAEAAISYVAAELGLTIEESKLNELAITVCYNYWECDLFFKGRTPPIRNSDLKEFVSTILSV